MFLDLRIPEIGQNSGEMNDGIVRGKVNQSLTTNLISNVVLGGTLYVYRKDNIAGGGFNFLDISAQAIADISNNFLPWGDNSTFTNEDTVYIACEHGIKDLYFNITTAAVWVGTVGIYDSTDGITANRELTYTETSNGFRNTGIHKITINHPETPSVAFSPVPGDIASRRWIVLKIKTFTSVTTVTKLQRMWVTNEDSAVKYTDLTSQANAAWDSNVFPNSGITYFYTQETTGYLAFPFLTYGVDLNIYRKLPDIMDREYRYLASDDTWKTLPNQTDTSNYFENGPATLGTTGQEFAVRWTIPSDWTEKTLNFAMSDGTTKTITGYWVRPHITLMKTLGPVPAVLYRLRGRTFGAANSSGLYHKNATTYNFVTFDIGIPSATATVIQLININTGKGTTFTIPANTSSSGSLPGQRIDLSPAFVLGAGESMAISYLSGGSLSDVEFHFSI